MYCAVLIKMFSYYFRSCTFMVKYWFKRKKITFKIQRNYHEDRNILRFSENGMYQEMVLDKSRYENNAIVY